MTQKEWQRCFSPAPAAFEQAVRQALQTKEEQRMKRIFPRTAAMALALLLILTGTALALGGGLMDFLHSRDLGEIKIQQPQLYPQFESLSILSDFQVTEAVCDGRSVHLIAAYAIDPSRGALVFANDWMKMDRLPFAAERAAAEQVYIVAPGQMTLRANGQEYDVWDSLSCRYDSAYALTVDVSFFVYDLALGDEVTISKTDTLEAVRAGTETYWDTREELPYEVTIPVQTTGTRVFEAVNLPLRLENYRINAARVTRTDLACYIEVEVEDDYDAEEYACSFVEVEEPYRYEREDGTVVEGVSVYEKSTLLLPLHGSWWFKALAADGAAYPILTSGMKRMGEDAEEWEHSLVVETTPRFEVGDTLVLQPFDSGTGEAYAPVALELRER